jgi:GNAT superfamily N-acetyltransferase
MTITEGDTSVFEMVATLREYRRKGFASTVIDRALMDLRQKNIKTISLRAKADGVSVYKKLGFKECFKRIVATCDWENIYKKGCPCGIENEKLAYKVGTKPMPVYKFPLERQIFHRKI